MSKNELQILARIILICVGLYVLLQTFLTVFSSLPAIALNSLSTDMNALTILISLITQAVMAIAAVYFLIRCSNRISAKIASAPAEDASRISWLAVAFRLICVTAGVMYFFWTLPHLSIILCRYMSSTSGHIYSWSMENLVEYLVMLLLSIYLAFGAPGFVRWQVKKTIKQCKKIMKQQIA